MSININQLSEKVIHDDNAEEKLQINKHKTAPTLNHPDGSVTTEKLANNAVTATKLADALDLTGKTITVATPSSP